MDRCSRRGGCSRPSSAATRGPPTAWMLDHLIAVQTLVTSALGLDPATLPLTARRGPPSPDDTCYAHATVAQRGSKTSESTGDFHTKKEIDVERSPSVPRRDRGHLDELIRF